MLRSGSNKLYMGVTLEASRSWLYSTTPMHKDCPCIVIELRGWTTTLTKKQSVSLPPVRVILPSFLHNNI